MEPSSPLTAIMAEPGLPQVIVTRAELYRFLTQRLKMPASERGFASADYLAFGRARADAPFTPEDEAREALEALAAEIEGQ